MGNRCVITTKKNFEDNGIGVYLHWNGGRDSVEAFLKYCELRGFRSPDEDCYGFARLIQVIANFFGMDGLSIGVDVVNKLDCDNWDNGVYLIENWNIVGREYFKGGEQQNYDLNDMMKSIDEAQPDPLGEEFFDAEVVDVADLKVGDTIFASDWKNEIKPYVIQGFGDGDHEGMPNILMYGDKLDRPDNFYRNPTARRLVSA